HSPLPLQTLRCNGLRKISDTAMSGVLTRFAPTLVTIDISACFKLTDETLSEMLSCMGLTHLNISRSASFTDESVCKIIRSCKRLTTLNVSQCRKISDYTMRRIGNHAAALTNLDVG